MPARTQEACREARTAPCVVRRVDVSGMRRVMTVGSQSPCQWAAMARIAPEGCTDRGERLLPPGEGVDLVRVEDVEARGGDVRLGWNVPQDGHAACVGVSVGGVKGGVESVAGP
jgi:hypothetical protein